MSNSQSVSLHYWGLSDCSARQAIDAIRLLITEELTGLLYSPVACHVYQSQGESEDCFPEIDPQLTGVFELKLWTPHWELRWLHQQAGRGNAVLLAENENLNPESWNSLRSFSNLIPQDNQYLLWGKTADSNTEGYPPNWSVLSEGRFGELPVPLSSVKTETYIGLKAVEYFGIDKDEDGNVEFIDERIVGFISIEEKTNA
ncbi:type III-D CRISPR-associated protein Csx19 [Rubinisphaera italica]|uniref:CRISPR-associated protein n=1 Tax=Rubinisphaera italica TaxID=2527969 RepID=A0A5C5XKH1_9PLAN|nr:CRISPR-associated protein Csx19 [Rubinisphaera italica]TWT63727.1 hypothetical protein Pan54_44850 [Rubinisphaera italica]